LYDHSIQNDVKTWKIKALRTVPLEKHRFRD